MNQPPRFPVAPTPWADPRTQRDPVPPVSPPAWSEPHEGSVGKKYGLQSRLVWAVGDNQEKPAIDAVRSEMLWRISVFGPVLVTIDYGTGMRRHFQDLRAPVVLSIPGQAQVYLRPVDADHDEAVSASVTITAATAGARAEARKIVDATGGSVDLDADAVSYFALTASTLTIGGVATAVAASFRVPLVTGSVLLTGAGFQEFEA